MVYGKYNYDKNPSGKSKKLPSAKIISVLKFRNEGKGMTYRQINERLKDTYTGSLSHRDIGRIIKGKISKNLKRSVKSDMDFYGYKFEK
jgi:hypothetical protein